MAARWYPISKIAHDAITAAASYAGPRIIIGDRLGPDAWPLVKTVLEKLGAVYVLGASAFEFEPDQDAHAIVSAALAAGRVMAAANADGFVPTPDTVAKDVVRSFAELTVTRQGEPLRVLEPSAGTGQLVRRILRDRPAEFTALTAVEMDQRRARQIPADATTHVMTFEAYAAAAAAAGHVFDRVVMNPPFSVPGHANLWAEHVLAAWKLLAPGGRLVAIVPRAVLNRDAAGLRGQVAALIAEHGGAEPLEDDAFASAGTMFPTAVMWLDRPLSDIPAPVGPQDPRPFVVRAYSGQETPAAATRPYLTPAAAACTPVQAYRHGWTGEDRILRYVGACVTCSRPTWSHDDGDNDPRGILGDLAADVLDPKEFGDHGMTGPLIARCSGCSNDCETCEQGEKVAMSLWTDNPAPAEPAPEVGSAVYDADSGEKVSPPGDRWWPNLRRARQAMAEMVADQVAPSELPAPKTAEQLSLWERTALALAD